MSRNVESSDSVNKSTVYGTIGTAIFLLFLGFSYLIPSFFPPGSLFIIAGTLMVVVDIIKLVKNIEFSLLGTLLGAASIIWGLNKMLELNLSFIPAFVIVLAGILLFRSINRLRNGQIFE